MARAAGVLARDGGRAAPVGTLGGSGGFELPSEGSVDAAALEFEWCLLVGMGSFDVGEVVDSGFVVDLVDAGGDAAWGRGCVAERLISSVGS